MSVSRSQHPHQAGVDVVGAQRAVRRAVPAEAEEVIALVQRQAQATRDRRRHLLGGLRAALLLQTAVVVDGHAAESRDFLAPQSGGPPPGTARQPDVLRLQSLAALAQEIGQLRAVHRAASSLLAVSAGR